MPSAARIGDKTVHGSPLSPGPGSHNVFINGIPAWRAQGDVHVCPVPEGPKVHGPGVVMNGSSKVFINQLAAVRQGDTIIEGGASAPNVIADGCAKVQIGG